MSVEKVKADSMANISFSNKDFWTTPACSQSSRVVGFYTKFQMTLC